MVSRPRGLIKPEQAELLRQIPSVDELLLQPRMAELAKRVDRNLLVEVTRAALADLRATIAEEAVPSYRLAADLESLQSQIADLVERILAHSLQPVINATGVIL